MTHVPAADRLPAFLRRRILHFETVIEQAVTRFAASLPEGAWVLDAGAGEMRYAGCFSRHRYIAADLAIGDAAWDYSRLHCRAALEGLPFRTGSFAACLNIVTLEHVRDPAIVLAELGRVLSPAGRLLLVAPHEWEEHQTPHDYFRFTRYGLRHLLESAGFTAIEIAPVGGFFRLLARRLCNAPQFFPFPVNLLAIALLAIPALLLPALDGLDRERRFTLGFICTATRS